MKFGKITTDQSGLIDYMDIIRITICIKKHVGPMLQNAMETLKLKRRLRLIQNDLIGYRELIEKMVNLEKDLYDEIETKVCYEL